MSKNRANISVIMTAQLLVSALLFAMAAWVYIDELYTNKAIQLALNARQPSPPKPNYVFPAGGRKIFPNHRIVALYGSPNAPVLGALGRNTADKSVMAVKRLAEQYQPYSKEKILPTFEIIATVASEFPTENNDYSRAVSHKTLQEWITAARKAGVYVVLDIQSGRTDFLTQAKELAPLLKQPNVGLALDPEWRLKSHQIPLVQIGHVSIEEVNRVAGWLAAFTHHNRLPQKLFLLHQFRNDMLPNRDKLVTTHRELAYAIQMDGQGTQSQKQDTWRAILRNAPHNTKFGWKNFYTKDTTLLTPKQTMLISPKPWYVSYQ